MKQRLLIISFSDIANDARVKKQVALFADEYTVTTCGFGESFRSDVEHLQLEDVTPQSFKYLEALALRAKQYAFCYHRHPRSVAARRALRGREFDVVLANDLDTLGVAHELVPAARIHADLHEFFPGLNDQDPQWLRLRKPFHEWALRRYAADVGSATTVSETIAERYETEFGFRCGVVRNAAPFAALEPGPVGDPIRVVHSGGAQPNRRIEVMMEAVARSSAPLTLDLYLTGVGSAYRTSLEALADDLGDRVTMHPPVPQSELLEVLNAYDVGIHVLPNTNTNNSLALPNKFFDYLQARLAMVIGPTADMQRLLERYDLGAVSDGFDVEAVTTALDALTAARVTAWKQHAHRVAADTSAESQNRVWQAAVAARAAVSAA